MDINELAGALGVSGDTMPPVAPEAPPPAVSDPFGGRVTDPGIAAELLKQLAVMGINPAAEMADSAINEFLDSVRQEAEMLVKSINTQVQDMNAKVEAIQQVVSDVTGAPAGDAVPETPPAPPPLPPEAAPPADMSAAMPPAPEAASTGAPASEAPPLPAEPTGGPAPMPTDVPSDKRVKHVLTPKTRAPKMWSPPANLVSAIKGGM